MSKIKLRIPGSRKSAPSLPSGTDFTAMKQFFCMDYFVAFYVNVRVHTVKRIIRCYLSNAQ